MKYTIHIKCLVSSSNDEATFTQDIEPTQLGSFVRAIANKMTDCNAWFTDEHGRECASIKRKRLGFHEFRLRELCLNGNLRNIGG